jgi:hypothetical protein
MRNALRPALLLLTLVVGTLVHTPATAAADASRPWTPGANAMGDDTYTGSIDSPVAASTVPHNSTVLVQGWVVDRTADGWTGIDSVEIYLGLRDQGGVLMSGAQIGQPRDDVAAALGNPFWATAGFSASFADNGLAVGSSLLTVYAHSPSKGWWYQQVEVRVPAAPDLAFADDPLLIVREVVPSLDVTQTTSNLTLRGYAIDRNLPKNAVLGVGGSGVSRIEIYLDGPRNRGGTFVAIPVLGLKNREATGFGQRFLTSGWEVSVHPSELSVDRHEFFIYALSAYWPNETLVIIPFNIR